MPAHGSKEGDKWFCGYWMDIGEWADIHDYAPPDRLVTQRAGESDINTGQKGSTVTSSQETSPEVLVGPDEEQNEY